MYQQKLIHQKQGEHGYDVFLVELHSHPLNASGLFYVKRGGASSNPIKEFSNRDRTLEMPILYCHGRARPNTE